MGWLTSQFVRPKWCPHILFGTTTWAYCHNQTPFFCSHIYFQTSLHQSPEILWLTSFHNPILSLDISLMFGHLIDVYARKEHPHQMCPLHIPLDNVIHPHTPLILSFGLTRTLGSYATCKLMGCGLPLGAFGFLLQVYHLVVYLLVHSVFFCRCTTWCQPQSLY